MNLNSPVTATLNPADTDAPSGFSVVRTDIARGVPYRLPFDPGGTKAVLSVATGLVRNWLNTPSDTTIARATDQTRAATARGDVVSQLAHSRGRASPRLIFMGRNGLVGVCPLIVNHRVLIPTDSGNAASAGFEIIILSFALHAGVLVGPSAAGNRIELAWRDIRDGLDGFDAVVCRADLRDGLSYLTGAKDARQRVAIDAEVASGGGAKDRAEGHAPGGLNWGITHDRV